MVFFCLYDMEPSSTCFRICNAVAQKTVASSASFTLWWQATACGHLLHLSCTTQQSEKYVVPEMLFFKAEEVKQLSLVFSYLWNKATSALSYLAAHSQVI